MRIHFLPCSYFIWETICHSLAISPQSRIKKTLYMEYWSFGKLSETTAAIRLLTAFNLMLSINFFGSELCICVLVYWWPSVRMLQPGYLSKNPRLPTDRHKQNKKLSLFMVTLLSLITWLPRNISHALLLSITKSCGTSWYDSPSKFIY